MGAHTTVTKPGPDRELDDIDVLGAIRDTYGPAVGTADVADELGVRRQTVDKYLRRLVDEGYVRTRKVGRSRVWWLSDEGELELAEHR